LGAVSLHLALVGGALLGLLFTASAVQVWWYPKRATVSCTADTLLVMGAAQYDGRPSPAFQRRLDKALELFESGCAQRIIVTGGRRPGDRYSEGSAGVQYLAAQGVPLSALRSETQSTTSFENLRNSRPLLDSEQLIIVTDDWHSYRSHWLARYLRLQVELAPVTTRHKPLHYWFRESIIMLAYRLGRIR
jgi:uncharacterized SAM-binding protein YcdF (DUF218 family)